ncbi:MAG TPA: serine/threonine-protein kinase [Pirellulaceae bacterium]|jgi:hypothetical protein
MPPNMLDRFSKLITETSAGSHLKHGMTAGLDLLKRQLWIWPLLAAAMMAVAGLMIRTSVEAAAQKEMAEGLDAMLKSNVEALRIWLEAEESQALTATAEPAIRKAASELARLATSTPENIVALTQSPAQESIRAALRPILARKHFAGYVLMSKDHVILAADRPELIGQQRTTSYDLVDRTIEHSAIVSPPFATAVLMRDSDGQMRAGQPTMFALGVQRDLTGDVVGVLGLRIRPEEDFVRILQIARPGKTGETYAFDESGLMLSESRFTPELARLALVPDQGVARSQLALTIRDPGANLVAGHKATAPRSEQPLTRMAASAVKDESGIDVTGYRNYLGVPVVGAWTWLPNYGLGVATEVEVAEAYRSLYILRRAFWSLFALLAASSVLILFFTVVVARVERAAQKAALMAKELGQYQLEAKLGEGGMGVVYRGRHRMLRRPTAIKLLHPDKTTDEAIARFEREVQLTCQLNHPNTIAIYDYGRTPEGIFFYAMEFLDGITLEVLVNRYGPQSEGRVIHILRQICGSLAEAHQIGLVHRDIKPANVMLGCRGGENDVVKVLDFGLVKAVDAKKESSLTSVGSIIGTPLYMSPESIENSERVDSRSDLYSVAAVGYFLLTGTPPFDGQNVLEICMHHSRTPPIRPSERLKRPVSGDLEAALLKGLEKSPHDRFASARAFAAALGACSKANEWNPHEAESWWHDFTGGNLPTIDKARTASISDAATVLLADGLNAS